MESININNFNEPKFKDRFIILTPKDENDEIISITITLAGFVISAKTWEALYSSNDEICFTIKGVSMSKLKNTIPAELAFKINENKTCSCICDVIKVINDLSKAARKLKP